MTDERARFLDMARTFPVRTGLLTVAPVVLALAQLCNAVLHDGPVVVSTIFAVVLVATVVGLTRWQLATYHRRRLIRETR